ncbi:MAG: RNA polymerase sigma factor [Lachnospiraceae bacterium]|nr:RNA polymerase sigma factor [Lachnospiraceae bacterium]
MKMEEKRLRELVDKAKQGDHAAFEELYSISCKKVYFTCINFLGNEEDARDVMQEVYTTAYEKLASLNDAEKFVPWINRIAVNRCKKILMKKAAVFMEIDDAVDELTEENENFLPEEYITQKEKRKLVMDIMRNTLSDIQYKTVILYYFNGLAISEIADIMECLPGTVMNRLSVARAKIRDGVDAYENKSGDKLYSVVGLPLLMRLLYEEAESMAVPDMLHNIMEAIRVHLAAGAVGSAAAAGETAGTTASAAAAGEAAGTTGSTAATGEAVQNTISGSANSIKGGIMKAGMNTLIAKIGIAAAIVAVIAVGAVFFMNNSKDEEASNGGTRDFVQEQTAGSGTGDNAQGQTADEALEMLNAEINAAIEVDQREAEERAQQLEEGYPEGIFPAASYICRDLLDEGSDIYIDKYILSSFDAGSVYFDYIYDSDTKIYTIYDTETSGFSGTKSHYLKGYLNENGDFIVIYYTRFDSLTDAGLEREVNENMFDFLRRATEECPEAFEVFVDDIEWVYVEYNRYNN